MVGAAGPTEAPSTSAPASPDFADRFWVRVDCSAGHDACWPWRGAKSGHRNGRQYGYIRLGGAQGGRVVGAHRAALWFATGSWGEGQDACHGEGCTTTLCVNPRHLRWGTHAENIAENIVRYGRQIAGRFGRRAGGEGGHAHGSE